MASRNSFGVNEEKIMFVINQIYKSCEKLNSLKLILDEEFQEFNSKYKDTFGTKFSSSLDSISMNYDIVVKNVLSFVTEFSKVNSAAKNMQDDISIMIKKDIANFNANNYIEKY